jgi:glycosyltransferase involved in cell wall biosynthesis
VEKLVIIPTYNERENIGEMLGRLLELPCAVDVLVVDDSSPDGTAEVVRAWMEREPRIHLLERRAKLGLGSAYRDGFRYESPAVRRGLLLSVLSLLVVLAGFAGSWWRSRAPGAGRETPAGAGGEVA